MAERLKGQLLDSEKVVDLVAGPDAYRDLPRLISAIQVLSTSFLTPSSLVFLFAFFRNFADSLDCQSDVFSTLDS